MQDDPIIYRAGTYTDKYPGLGSCTLHIPHDVKLSQIKRGLDRCVLAARRLQEQEEREQPEPVG